MCGLVGATGYLNQKDLTVFTILFHTNVWRGVDGCGMIRCYNLKDKKDKLQGYYSYHNEIDPSSDYVLTTDYHKLIGEGEHRLIAGHSRAATKGKVTVDNTHPFECGDIIGMHNGTIQGKFDGSKNYETDTEALFNLIDKLGLKEALDKVYEQSTSMAYCLVYFDKKKDRVFIIRDSNRPLYIAKNKHFTGKIFWASEKAMLTFALDKANLLNDYEIEPLPVGELIEIAPYENDSTKRITYHKDWFKHKPKVVSYSSHNHTNYSRSNNYNNYSGYGRRGGSGYSYDGYGDYGGFDDPLPSQSNTNSSTKIQIGNIKITMKMFNDNLQKGCMMCGSPHTLINNNFNMKFPPNQTSEYMCEDCDKDYTEEQLTQLYGIDKTKFVTPKIVSN